MGRIFQYLIVGLVVSLFYFSFGFTFLPAAINSKLILAVGGVLLASYHAAQNRGIRIDRPLLGAIGLALLFSVICFIAVDYSYTDDLSYATYIVSFLVWLFAAYTVCVLIRWVHKEVDLKLITCYLAAVCFAQCVFALLINNNPALQALVNLYIEQGQELLLEVNRLYGIGASLDNAGVRFSIVLILIAAVLSKEAELRNTRWKMALLMVAFFSIVVIGNMMSRTTSIGAMLALLYLMWNTGLFRMVIKPEFLKLHLLFGSILILALLVTLYFFRNDRDFNEQIRFAFEGFFNWFETGEWRTDSTDKLNNKMWIWPTDARTWIIGTGLFDNWIFGTDIGYCRFILYCGLPGFAVFALFFVYNAAVFIHNHRTYRDMFYFLLVITFIIWIKVSTDIFLIYALFYCMDMLNRSHHLTHQDENSLLYSRYV